LSKRITPRKDFKLVSAGKRDLIVAAFASRMIMDE
jgi:hypothetical protein